MLSGLLYLFLCLLFLLIVQLTSNSFPLLLKYDYVT